MRLRDGTKIKGGPILILQNQIYTYYTQVLKEGRVKEYMHERGADRASD